MECFIKRACVEAIIILNSDDDGCIPNDGDISRQNYVHGKTIRTQQQEMQEQPREPG